MTISNNRTAEAHLENQRTKSLFNTDNKELIPQRVRMGGKNRHSICISKGVVQLIKREKEKRGFQTYAQVVDNWRKEAERALELEEVIQEKENQIEELQRSILSISNMKASVPKTILLFDKPDVYRQLQMLTLERLDSEIIRPFGWAYIDKNTAKILTEVIKITRKEAIRLMEELF